MSYYCIYRNGMNHIVKHLLSMFVRVLTARAALSLEWLTFSHLRWADGLGRFSGTMVSSELIRHGWHCRWLLHCIPPFLDSATNSAFATIARSLMGVEFSSPFCKVSIMHAIPTTKCLLHDPSLLGLKGSNMSISTKKENLTILIC